jgi:hypothetical protein
VKLSERLIASGVKPSTNPNSLFQKAFAKEGVPETVELRRVRDLPRRQLNIDGAPDLSDLWRKPGAPCPGCDLCGFDDDRHEPKLLPVQSAALLEAERAGALLGQIGVGKGKAGISFLLPDVLGSRCAVVMLPPQLVAQTLRAVLPMWQRHFNLPSVCTRNPLAHKTARERGHKICTGILHFVAYSILSSPTQGEVLEWIGPDLLVLDEGHSPRALAAAPTRHKQPGSRTGTRGVRRGRTRALLRAGPCGKDVDVREAVLHDGIVPVHERGELGRNVGSGRDIGV